MKSLYGKVAVTFAISAIISVVLIPPIFLFVLDQMYPIPINPQIAMIFKRFMWIAPCIYLSILTIAIGFIVVRPVNVLSGAVKKVALGDYDQEIENDRTDEIGVLIDNFNTMARQIRSTEILNKNFISSVSHEFKTPLTAIVGFAEELKDESVSEEKKEEIIDIIMRESKRLSSMSTNILILSRLDSDKLVDKREIFDLGEQVRESILILQQSWEEKNLSLDIDIDDVNFSGSENLLKQVWLNLLSNAIKFSNPKGDLKITLRAEEKITFSVTNYGYTIKESEMPFLFNMFYKADKSRSSEGNGLGLAIASKIVDIHKGKIKVTSGSGKTTFEVIL